jgi:lauroyl/myristoyl acyltransferase
VNGAAFRHRFEGPFWRRVMLAGLKAMPQKVQRASMPLWASFFFGALPVARRAVVSNLDRLCGPAPALVAQGRALRLFVNYAQAVANMYLLHLGITPELEAEWSGLEHLGPLQAAKRGAVAVTGHMGYWQLTPFLLAQVSSLPPMTMAMAEEPNAEVARFEQQFRAKHRIVYTTSSPFASLELAAVLRRGELVGMQLDRHMGGAHARLPFAGGSAAFPLGPATLARATGSPLLPVFVVAQADRTRCRILIEKPIEVPHTRDRNRDVLQGTAELVAVYERIVREHPDQWFHFHDFWE